MEKKIERFLEILNIPASKPSEFFELSNSPDNNWFYFLHDLNIIEHSYYNQIMGGSDVLRLNQSLHNYIKEATLDYGLKDSPNEELIVDFGCGWGFLALWMAQFQYKKIYAVGYPEQILFLEKVYGMALRQGLVDKTSKIIFIAEPLTIKSVSPGTFVTPESIDKFILNDVIEHFHPSLYFNLCLVCYNALRNGGQLISKSHNTNNNAVLTRLKDYWNKCEETYLRDQRIKYLREKHDLPEATAAQLAKNTRGYSEEGIDGAVANFVRTGNLLPYNHHLVPVDISLDNYMLENYVSPEFFKTFLSFFGFKTTLLPGISSSHRLSVFKPVVNLFPEAFLKIQYFSAVIIIKAIKVK